MLSRASFLLLGTVGFGYWSSKDDEDQAPLIESEIPLVIIPGLKGSVLANRETNDIHYVTAEQSLNSFWSKPLSLPITWKDNVQDRDDLEAIWVLKKICFLPSVCWKVYDDVISWGEEHNKKEKRPFYEFSYDWRRDLVENQKIFEEFLEEIKKRHNKPVQVLAHSMGGILTMATVNSNSSLFHSVVFVGVPFGCGIGYLQDLHTSVPLGYNVEALNPSVLFTHPSSFWTFPSDEEFSPFYQAIYQYDASKKWKESELPAKNYAIYSVSDKLLKTVPQEPELAPKEEEWELSKIEIDFYNAKEWKTHKLGLFARVDVDEEKCSALLEHLQKCLDQGKLIRSMIQYKEGVNYPPLTVVSGNTYPTTVTILKDGPLAIDGFDYYSAPKVAGDGRIPYDQSFPDPRIPHQRHSSDKHHQTLLKDLSTFHSLLNNSLSKQ